MRFRLQSYTVGISLTALTLALIAGQASAQSGTQTVLGTTAVFGSPAGNSGLPGGATAPTAFLLTPGTSRLLTFSSVTGSASLNGTQFYGPDGGIYTGVANTNIGAFGGLTGIFDSFKFFTGALFAVFTAGPPVGSTSAQTDITSTQSNTAFNPSLNQVFFVGDGLVGNGSGATQQFFVPNGATTLFLGIVDSNTVAGSGGNATVPGAYGDNAGSFVANFQVSATAPEPTTLALAAVAILSTGVKCFRRRSRGAGI